MVRARASRSTADASRRNVTERGPTADLFRHRSIASRAVGRPGGGGSERRRSRRIHRVAAFERLHQRPARRNAGHRGPVSDERRSNCSRTTTAHGSRCGTSYTDQGEFETGARGGAARCPPFAARAPRALSKRPLADSRSSRYDDAFETFSALNEERSTPAVLNNLGVVQLRRGATRESGLPAYYFNESVRGRRRRPRLLLQPRVRLLGRERHAGGHLLAARGGSARPRGRRRPLRARRRAGGCRAHRGSGARKRTREAPVVDVRTVGPPSGADAVPRGLERVKPDVELPHAQSLEGTLTSTEQRDQQELARFYLDRGRRLFGKESDREALVELNRALFLSPYPAGGAPAGRPYSPPERPRSRGD